MPEQALYLRWRPTSFEEFVGQEHISRTLRNAMKTGRVRHAYLFSGPRGTGKTTTARLLAKAVNCLSDDPDQRPCNQCANCIAVNDGRFLDLIEIDAATHTGVDDVRDLREKIAFAPGEGRFKVYIIDEVHRFTGNAFDALLKTLEEPPEHAMFVLATTEIDKVPQTIKSRCLQFEFRRFSVREVADRLETIVQGDGLQYERAALEMIARQGTGSMRDSISLLDQIVTDPDQGVTVELVQQVLGTVSTIAVRELVDAIAAGDVGAGLRIINQTIDMGSDPRQFGQQIIEYLRAVLLTQTATADLVEASQQEREVYQHQAQAIPRGLTIRLVKNFNDALANFRGGWQPQLTLELALVESMRSLEPVEEAPVRHSPARTQPTASVPVPSAPPVAELEPAEEMPKGSPPVISLAKLRDNWTEFQRLAFQLNKQLPALLEHCQVRTIDGNVVIINTKSDFFRQKLEAPDKRNAIERALSEMFGVRLKTRIVAQGGDIVDSSSDLYDSVDPDDPVQSQGMEMGARIKPIDHSQSDA